MMKELFFICISMLGTLLAVDAQTTFTGKIYEASGEPMIGALIEILETDQKAITDLNGSFAIEGLEDGDYVINVSYVGYEDYIKPISLPKDANLEITVTASSNFLKTVEVNSLRVEQEAPFSFENIDEEEIRKANLGQDIPYLLRNTPSVVVTSDAGAGIGYTGIRVRGSDATRTNVVINDIPLNDSESQGTFWVNLPDLASSTNSIQIQRGVGASTNGAGAFGASVHIDTKGYEKDAFVELSNTLGSFNTRKHTLNLNSGLLKNNLVFSGRLSLINSDGYVDRATSDLRSAFLSAGYFVDDFSVQAIAMLGKERTFQSWFGTPEALVEGDRDALTTHYFNNVGVLYNTVEDSINLFTSDRRYNYYLYEDEVDDYRQDHYQVHINKQFLKGVSGKLAFHYTRGRGFFEQFRFNDDLADYGLPNVVIGGEEFFSTNLVRRRWLDNDFYGAVASVNFGNEKTDVTIGGAVHRYDGDHFGEIIQADLETIVNEGANYYDGVARKDDANIYAQLDHSLSDKLSAYVDLQFRAIDYTTTGVDNDLVSYDVDETFGFFNPKVGLTYRVAKNQLLYSSLGVANKEPSRSDFIDAFENEQPTHETLYDLELGYKKLAGDFLLNANLYYMSYDNQLVPTGELNDVGATIRRNVDDSFRAGIEINGSYQINDMFIFGANATLSQNKINFFNEVIYDYTNGFEVITNGFENTDIAFSPNVIAGAQLIARPIENFEIGLYPKYVGRQFLDNTSNEDRALDSYLVTDLLGQYIIPSKRFKEISVNLKVNNLFNTLYSANGYTYSFVFGDLITENFLYPQAGTNFLAGLTIRF